MPSRHEEKYIITYQQYARLKARALGVLTPDANAKDGSYVITSLYFDDPLDSALYEKLDGLGEHSKFRIRTYDYNQRVIKLERKDKNGIITHKLDAPITREQIPLINGSATALSEFSGGAYDLAAQIRAGGYQPSVVVRYRRDAFTFCGSDLRLTFDTQMEAITADSEALFDPNFHGLPVFDANTVIMEIKYGDHLHSFIRKLTQTETKQLSVSKYALCREALK